MTVSSSIVFKTHSYFSYISRKNPCNRSARDVSFKKFQSVLVALFLFLVYFCFFPVCITQLIHCEVSVKGRSVTKLQEILSNSFNISDQRQQNLCLLSIYFLMSAQLHVYVFIFTIRRITVSGEQKHYFRDRKLKLGEVL